MYNMSELLSSSSRSREDRPRVEPLHRRPRVQHQLSGAGVETASRDSNIRRAKSAKGGQLSGKLRFISQVY